jgi:hypothetical protein
MANQLFVQSPPDSGIPRLRIQTDTLPSHGHLVVVTANTRQDAEPELTTPLLQLLVINSQEHLTDE